MPRTAIPVQSMGRYGGGFDDIAYTAGDDANNHEFVNNGKSLVIMKNGSGGPLTADVIGVANSRTWNRAPTEVITCGAADECIYGPFPVGVFNQDDGTVQLDLTDDTNIEFAVVEYKDTPK